MKMMVTCLLLCQVANVGWSQVSVNFANRVGATLRAPIYGVEPVCQSGNAPDGIPVGAAVYSASLLAGSNYTAALYAGPAVGSSETLLPAAFAVFGTGSSAGFFNGGMVPLTSVSPGSSIALQVRVWANRGGSVTSWAAAQADPTIPKGTSIMWTITPTAGQTTINLTLLRSFSLCRADSHPRLSIARRPMSGGISIFWPVDFDYFQAQSTTNLAGVVTWIDLTNTPVTDGGRLRIDLPYSSSMTFLRLADFATTNGFGIHD